MNKIRKAPEANFQRILLSEDASLSLLLQISRHKFVEKCSGRGPDRARYAPAGAVREMRSPAAGLYCRLTQKNVLAPSVGKIEVPAW
jgi:hypothetical protein